MYKDPSGNPWVFSRVLPSMACIVVSIALREEDPTRSSARQAGATWVQAQLYKHNSNFNQTGTLNYFDKNSCPVLNHQTIMAGENMNIFARFSNWSCTATSCTTFLDFASALKANNKKYVESYNSRDMAGIQSVFAPDARLMPPGHPAFKPSGTS